MNLADFQAWLQQSECYACKRVPIEHSLREAVDCLEQLGLAENGGSQS